MTRRRQSPSRTATISRERKPAPLRAARVVDLARVARARQRIATGWYDRSDVRNSLVDAVLQEIRGR